MDLHNVDLNLLVAFDALMVERSVTKAAKRTGRTQPAMSAALSRLRALCGDELFVRSREGLKPTARASELSEPIGRALREIGLSLGLSETFDAGASELRVTVAMQEHAAYRLTGVLLAELSARAPAVKLDVLVYQGREQGASLLETGEAEVALGVPPAAAPGRIFTRPLFEERYVCIVRRGHPVLARAFDLEAFLGLRHVLATPENHRFGHTDVELAKLGRERTLGLTITQMYPIPALVATSDMVATVMEGVVAASGLGDRLAVLPPPLALEPCAYVMSWHRRHDAHPAQRWLRGCIGDVASAGGPGGAR